MSTTSNPLQSPPSSTTTEQQEQQLPQPVVAAWKIDFGPSPSVRRKMSKKERQALAASHRTTTVTATTSRTTVVGPDSEGNEMAVVQVDGMEDPSVVIPKDLTTTRTDLEQRFILRVPRLLCVMKQYPRSCGITSLSSIYNYLYSCLGESPEMAARPPVSQEEIMTILGFQPPFGEIPWGPFTGNATLIRWFNALNQHFGQKGRAYILYKVHGIGNTSRWYASDQEALTAVKEVLRNPHCALVYHCYNHYMVPVGYQDIPRAQVDFLKAELGEAECETTVFIGDVSRGKHEAMYARKWSDIVKDLSCVFPDYFNIRRTDLGIQKKEPKAKESNKAAVSDCPVEEKPVGNCAVMEGEDERLVSVDPSPNNIMESNREGKDEAEEDPTERPSVADEEDERDEEDKESVKTKSTTKKKRRKLGNLHCLICFRNDECGEAAPPEEEAEEEEEEG